MLKIHVFGRDHAGRNAFVKLQQQMQNLKVTVEGGIQKWAFHRDDFQCYIPHMPGEAGELKDMVPVPLTEMEAQVILDGALHNQYHQELVKLDWNIFTQPLEETISKLESAEPDILMRKKNSCQDFQLPSPTKSASSTTKRKAHTHADGNSPKKQKKSQCPISVENSTMVNADMPRLPPSPSTLLASRGRKSNSNQNSSS